MKIPKYQDLRVTAARRLGQAPDSRKIVIQYTLIITVAALLISGVQFGLDARIAKTTGLRDLGVRSFLSAVSQFLPVLQQMLMLVMEFGYLAAMVRISRGQYTSPRTLKTGLDRFWPLLRLSCLKMLIYSAFGFGAFYLAIALYLISPFSNRLMDVLAPVISGGAALNPDALMTLDDTARLALLDAIRPAYYLLGLVSLVMIVPVIYRYRMADYVLYDHPEEGALYALRESRKMMRGNAIPLFRLDLHLWWYYGLMGLIMAAAYADLLLSLLGVTLPLSANARFFLFYGLSLALQFAAYCLLRNRVATVYALAYDAIRPAPQEQGVVLGNIFQM